MTRDKTQRHRRFEYYCHGYLIKNDRSRHRFLVDDISESGIKIQLEDADADLGGEYRLLICFGILRSAEVKAKAVWKKEGILGLEISVPDQAWRDLVVQVEKGQEFVF